MQKESFYFPHFCNARHDRKIQRMRSQLGVEGYGIYFMLLEVLREQHDLHYPFEDLDLLATEFNTSLEKIGAVVTKYGLFDIDEEQKFFSPKMLVYLEPYFRIKQQRIEAGKASALKRKLNEPTTTVETTVQQSKVKESKENEKKENESKSNKSKLNDFLLSEFFQNQFEKLWIYYGRKGSKQKALLEVKKLNEQDLKNFCESEEHILAYVENTKEEPRFRKDFERYISNKYWESDIFKSEKLGKIGKTMQLYNNLINKDF